ncbi:LysR family transcriptional regulator [Paraburkholderia caribensis]|uniref:LysR family transcriptional regulator n=1 Tax=Paraburkholderia caribensis TaxID=75105 RepID=UPI001CB57CEF|nr:LysR family transcriptional regulator [Paraburkholderia caribensis]CAG9243763.1 DNA-binding transcriptional regulator, LysR family [Paraburkholderia caribensis]
MDRFASMGVFVRVVEKGSFSAAADGSGMTSTMVGNHIRDLEKLLAVRLLQRTTRHQALTEAGKEYYTHCVQILRQVQEVEMGVREMRTTPRGCLRVSAPINFGSECLAPELFAYREACPEVTVELSLADRLVDISKEGFDVAIRVGTMADSSSYVARPLKPWKRILCASPDYLRRNGTPQELQDLVKHDCLCFAYPNGLERDWKFPSSTTGVVDLVHVSGSLSINNGHALRAAALSGHGIVFQPEALLRPYIDSGRLVRVLPGEAVSTSPLQVVYLKDHQMTPKISHFINFLLERFG